MSSILNSILAGDLEVRQAPQEKPVKEDSIIELLQNSEIQITACPEIADKLEGVNTGFGENNDLYYTDACKSHELKTPLYQENYLREFKTEEEKAAARHALGLYNKGDVVAMSMITAEDSLPSNQDWTEAALLQLRKGDKFFTPFTSFNAVFDSSGLNLNERLAAVNSLITAQQKALARIEQVSNLEVITSLGDVTVFLQGFNNGDNLHNTLDVMSQEMLRFEKTGSIQQ